MSKRHMCRAGLLWGIAAMMVVIVTGCGAKPTLTEESGLTLKYHMPPDRVLQYHLSSGFLQTMEVEDRSVAFTADETRVFTVEPKGQSAGNFELAVTVDSMAFTLTAPQGQISPDLSGVAGRGFDLSLSPTGQESGLSEAEPVEYELIPGQKQNALSGFAALFPDLPPRPVQVGDRWISFDTVFEKSATGELCLIFESRNRLEGFEMVNGTECAKITADVKGTIDGVSREMGADLVSRGKIKGQATWYFDHIDGIFVEMTSKGMGKSTVSGEIPKKISIPVKREYAIEMRLIR